MRYFGRFSNTVNTVENLIDAHFRLVYVNSGLEVYGYNAFPYTLDTSGMSAHWFCNSNSGQHQDIWLILQNKENQWGWEYSVYQCHGQGTQDNYSYFICQDEKRSQ